MFFLLPLRLPQGHFPFDLQIALNGVWALVIPPSLFALNEGRQLLGELGFRDRLVAADAPILGVFSGPDTGDALIAGKDPQPLPEGGAAGVGVDGQKPAGRQGLAVQESLVALHQKPDGMKDVSFWIGHHMEFRQEFAQFQRGQAGFHPETFKLAKVLNRGSTGFQRNVGHGARIGR